MDVNITLRKVVQTPFGKKLLNMVEYGYWQLTKNFNFYLMKFVFVLFAREHDGR